MKKQSTEHRIFTRKKLNEHTRLSLARYAEVDPVIGEMLISKLDGGDIPEQAVILLGFDRLIRVVSEFSRLSPKLVRQVLSRGAR